MKNIIYPYPFKLSTTGDLSDGIVFQIPSFCKSNHKTKKWDDMKCFSNLFAINIKKTHFYANFYEKHLLFIRIL